MPNLPSATYFGASVDLEGDTLVVGATGDHFEGVQGRVYVFDSPTQWKVIGSGTSIFGGGVELNRDRLAVRDLTSVVIFRRSLSGWTTDFVIHESASALAFNGIVLAIGSVSDGVGGQVKLYEEEVLPSPAWIEVEVLTPSDVSRIDNFGSAVDVDGGWLVVGAPLGGAAGVGVAYVFRRDRSGSWWEHQKIQPAGLSANALFGGQVALRGELIAIAAPGDESQSSGSVSLYRYDPALARWVPEGKLYPRPGDAEEAFGVAIAIGRNGVFVGAPTATVRHCDLAGKVYHFSRTDLSLQPWSLSRVMHASDFCQGTLFGQSLAWNDNKLVVGASGPLGVVLPPEGGAAYLYEFDAEF